MYMYILVLTEIIYNSDTYYRQESKYTFRKLKEYFPVLHVYLRLKATSPNLISPQANNFKLCCGILSECSKQS